MPLDTNIALGVKPIEQPNMLAQMGQMMQLRQAQQEYEGSNALRDAFASGGNLNDPAFIQRLRAANPKMALDIEAKHLAGEKTRSELLGNAYKNSREALTTVNSPESLRAYTISQFSDPIIGPALKAKGMTPESALANLDTEIAKSGFDNVLKKSAMGLDNFFKDQTTQRGQNLSHSASMASVGATMRGQDITDRRSREQFQYNIDNPKFTPLAGEKVVNGEKVPAYFGFDPNSNTMVETAMPTVSIGAPTTINTPTNALAPTAAPANVNALAMPPAGAPTSPVARPATAAMPSAVAPSAAMPSAASPTSVVPGGANAPAAVRFGPKSTAENLTEAQGKSTGFALRAKQASDILDIVGKDGKIQPGVLKRVGESVPLVGEGLGTMLNFTQSAPEQRVEQAQRSFVNAILRQESGAAINESEFNNAKKQYFPQPGDSKDVIEQKRLNRETAVKSLEVAAGPGMKQAAPTTGIKAGTVEEGYRFKGGDPANKNNWVKE